VSDRFYVLHSTGGFIPADGRRKGGGRVSEWMVLDRAYCHRVVYSSSSSPVRIFGSRHTKITSGGEAVARELCRRLNVEDALEEHRAREREAVEATGGTEAS
jgi:hypothetical protein